MFEDILARLQHSLYIRRALWDSSTELDNGVVLYHWDDGALDIRHFCSDKNTSSKMILRENDTGPMYWCISCGYTTEEGASMAIRLYEVNI